MILAVLGVFLISASYTFYGQITYFLSAIGWIYVGMQWGDRAIMIGSAVTGTAVAMSLIENLPKYLNEIDTRAFLIFQDDTLIHEQY